MERSISKRSCPSQNPPTSLTNTTLTNTNLTNTTLRQLITTPSTPTNTTNLLPMPTSFLSPQTVTAKPTPVTPPKLPRTLTLDTDPKQKKVVPISDKRGLVTLTKASFLRRVRREWPLLLDPKEVSNLCFFFERPFSHEDYKKANTNKALDSQGAFSHSRWSQIGEIHVLFPSEAGHFYIARRADLPHYQEVFSKFVTALESFDDAMVVYLYLPERNYKNHFLTVRNSLERVQPFVDQIDWMEVHRLACRPKQTIAKKSVGRKRQDTFEDTGFCSSVNQTREGTLDGVAEPRMKPGTTTNSEVTNAYVVLSKFLAKTGARWSSDPLYYDPLEPQRQKRFAGRIHVDNVFECMRMSVTDLQSKCACHRDEHNSTNPAFSAVVGLSVVRKVGGKEVRIAINAQGRRSIDDCLSRSTTYGPLIAMVVETFESMPPSRQILSKSSFDKHNVGGMAGFLCTKSPCHMPSVRPAEPPVLPPGTTQRKLPDYIPSGGR
jgi:hypothetical protein